MPIDVHAHYVPPRLVQALEQGGSDYGVNVLTLQPSCQKCLQFEYGLKIRPFFPRLEEDEKVRIERFTKTGIDRQILSIWADIFAYGLPKQKGHAWHRLMNDVMSETCARHPDRFSWLASGALQDPAGAARELERAVRESGAIGGVIGASVEGINLGEVPMDEYWAAASALKVPVFIHPAAPEPPPRAQKFALNQVAQYTFDTTASVGSMIMSGVLDRFPDLNIILSHGGGTIPYLIGRFDLMYDRSDKASTGIAAKQKPSAYLRRFHYDTILHDPQVLRFLAQMVRTDRIVLGSDDPFPPADRDPLGSLRAAGFSDGEISTIADENPHRLFRL
jgi:aminocarboxymuconate-semialdehyde decarboxylase